MLMRATCLGPGGRFLLFGKSVLYMIIIPVVTLAVGLHLCQTNKQASSCSHM